MGKGEMLNWASKSSNSKVGGPECSDVTLNHACGLLTGPSIGEGPVFHASLSILFISFICIHFTQELRRYRIDIPLVRLSLLVLAFRYILPLIWPVFVVLQDTPPPPPTCTTPADRNECMKIVDPQQGLEGLDRCQESGFLRGGSDWMTISLNSLTREKGADHSHCPQLAHFEERISRSRDFLKLLGRDYVCCLKLQQVNR
ncbi:hypothetical protein BJX70DRAFT_133449 [Aspergillus crustosus]